MKCPHCGSENPDNSKYCNLCLKSFQTPAEVEFAEEVRQRKEQTTNVGYKFNYLKLLAIIGVSLTLGAILFAGIKTLKKSVGFDFVKSMTGVSTSKKGIRVKKIIGGKTVEAYVGHAPKDFPSYLVYEGAKIKISQRQTDPAGKISFMVIFETKDNNETIMAFYKKNLEAKQFEVTLPPAEAIQDAGILSFSKANAKGKIMISAADNMANINVTYSVSFE